MTSGSTPTLLFLHAHPDDECVLTGKTIATAAAAGLRTIVVYATRGDAGETSADLGGETLGERRTAEALAACDALGAARVEFLGYDDSGMAETDTTSNPAAFCNAEPGEAAERLTWLLADEAIDIVVGYDRNGTYGHPDHIAIHHLAHAAAPMLDANAVLDATYDRDYMAALENNGYGEIDDSFALPGHEFTHFVQSEWALRVKLTAIAHHRSQVPDDFDADEPDVVGFSRMFGTEWFAAKHLRTRGPADPLPDFFEPRHRWPGAPPLV